MQGDDGTFSYYEGALCSYYGIGKWRVDGDVVCLSDDAEAGFHMLRFQKETDFSLAMMKNNEINR